MSWTGSLIEGQRDPSGQMYRRNRFYDPQSGRFTQEDPIGIAGGLNVYGYANGDPVSYGDPYGLCAQAAGDTTPGGMKQCHYTPRSDGVDDESVSMFLLVAPVPKLGGAFVQLLGKIGTRIAGLFGREAAEQAGKIALREGDAFLAVVHEGRMVAHTPNVSLSHAAFVERTVGTLPEGARVVTVGKFEGQVNVLNSKTFHGNQLPAPQDAIDAIRAIFH